MTEEPRWRGKGPLAGHVSRRVDVDLDAAVSFEMWEALGQPRPSQWSRIWPSAVALSQWLLEQPVKSLPASARELGCGVGLVGMTLAHLGVRVEGTNRNTTALAYAQHNAQHNGLAHYTVREVDWDEPCGAPTPLLVASDVLYEPRSVGSLFERILQGLRRHGRLMLAGPVVRAGLLDELVLRLAGAGFGDALELRPIEWQGYREQIAIHVLSRPARAVPRRSRAGRARVC